MGTLNNIFNLKIQSVSGPGSMNFGNSFNVGAESNEKAVGGSQLIGDFGNNLTVEANGNLDNDLIDQV
ncbi:Spore germination protein gerPA/gerPF [Marininema mesophilum]|uniref:Spore germination protein gerPA/gerPF n=1 Tax=Marininema mesophilum TaxID=1048340 RepID=A0A1H2WPP7_9BACL|nr:spore germination protein [Marininema mesophilum]SDW81969.1 Spore germination protein gerPA/gerPF [Marininema mesophilum]